MIETIRAADAYCRQGLIGEQFGDRDTDDRYQGAFVPGHAQHRASGARDHNRSTCLHSQCDGDPTRAQVTRTASLRSVACPRNAEPPPSVRRRRGSPATSVGAAARRQTRRTAITPQAVTTMRSSTCTTPLAAQAAFSAARRSYGALTWPASVTLPPSTETEMEAASRLA